VTKRRAGTSRRDVLKAAAGAAAVVALPITPADARQTDLAVSPQGRYLNAALALDTALAPHALLAFLLELEGAAGRRRDLRDGPRTLDLDLLLHGDACIETPELWLPHPRLHERSFVLVPLAEIAANVVHPRLQVRVSDLAQRVSGLPQPRPTPQGWPVPGC